MADEQIGCKLLALPAELRSRIWHFVVPENKVFLVNLKESKHFGPMLISSVPVDETSTAKPTTEEVSSMRGLQIARTCRWIRAETSSMCYSRNTFAFSHGTYGSSFEEWLDARKGYAKYLNKVDIIDSYCTNLKGQGSGSYYLRHRVHLDKLDQAGERALKFSTDLAEVPSQLESWFYYTSTTARHGTLSSFAQEVYQWITEKLEMDMLEQGRVAFDVRDWLTVWKAFKCAPRIRLVPAVPAKAAARVGQRFTEGWYSVLP